MERMNHQDAWDQSSRWVSMFRKHKAILVTCGAFLGFGMGLSSAQAQTAQYRVDFDVTWSSTTHPGAIHPLSHFDSVTGATHSDAVSFWRVGELATPGVKQEAEEGVSPLFDDELNAALTAGTAHGLINEPGWICPGEVSHANCRAPNFTFEASESHSKVTFLAMIGPSPDWFVGVSEVALRDNGAWVTTPIVLPILPYDGGTRSNDATFGQFGPLNNPPEAISLITDTSGQFMGGASLGTMTITLIPEPATAVLLGLGLGGLALVRRRSR